jgi:hypothetical protein
MECKLEHNRVIVERELVTHESLRRSRLPLVREGRQIPTSVASDGGSDASGGPKFVT